MRRPEIGALARFFFFGRHEMVQSTRGWALKAKVAFELASPTPLYGIGARRTHVYSSTDLRDQYFATSKNLEHQKQRLLSLTDFLVERESRTTV